MIGDDLKGWRKTSAELIHRGLQQLQTRGLRLSESLKAHPGARLRPRVFTFFHAKNEGGQPLSWPTDWENTPDFPHIQGLWDWGWTEVGVATEIAKAVASPREALRVVRRLEAATRWAEDRIEGLERGGVELEKQQARAVEALEAELALKRLAGVGGKS